jgi:hypothetical protein
MKSATVIGLARLYRDRHFQHESPHMTENSSPEDALPERIPVTEEQLAGFTARNEFSKLAHELYKEAAGVVIVAASVRFREEPYLTRNHAILVALLVRIFKFMRCIAILTAGSPESREVVYALNRCIAESLINFFYLMRKDDEALFDDFVSKSLGPEKEIREEINAAIAARGGEAIPMEKRMLESIDRVFKNSGVDPATVPVKHQDWAENMRKRLEALEWPKAYAFLYRQNSHAIHGTWVDLLMNDLDYIGPDQFDYDPDCGVVDSRLLSPIARLSLDAAGEYLGAVSQKAQGCAPLLARIEELQQRTELVSVWFEKFLTDKDDEGTPIASDAESAPSSSNP